MRKKRKKINKKVVIQPFGRRGQSFDNLGSLVIASYYHHYRDHIILSITLCTYHLILTTISLWLAGNLFLFFFK